MTGRCAMALTGALTVLAASAGCSTGNSSAAGSAPAAASHAEFSRKLYVDAEGIGVDADTIVRGSIDKIVTRLADNGGNVDEPGIPMIMYRFNIAKMSKSGDNQKHVNVLWPDSEKVNVDDVVPLEVGQDYELYLDRLDANDAPGIDPKLTPVYVPVSGPAGVFKVAGDKVTATDKSVKKLRKDGPNLELDSRGFATVNVAQLESLAADTAKQ